MDKEIEYLPNSKINPMPINTVYPDDEENLEENFICEYDDIQEYNKEKIEYLPYSKIDLMEVNTVYQDDEETIQDLVCKFDNDIKDIKEDIENIDLSLDNLENEVNKLKEGNIEIDLTNYVTKTELSLKVDKETGKSLISDSEIERLSTLKNYDDTDIKNTLNSKANKTELHSHTNKSVLDNISSAKVKEWNNKSNFSGNYNDLTNKPTIPTKTSQLNNDSNFISSIPSEYVTETELKNKGYLTQHQDLSSYATKNELTTEINNLKALLVDGNEVSY